MKANDSKLRRPLLWIWLILALGALVFLTAPTTAPLFFKRLLAQKGWKSEGCAIAYASPYLFSGSACTIEIPLGGGTLKVALDGFELPLTGTRIVVRSGSVTYGDYSASVAGEMTRGSSGGFRIDADLSAPKVPLPMVIESGAIAVSGEIGERSEWTINGRDVTGKYGEVGFSKATGAVTLSDFPDWKSRPAPFRVSRVDIGIPLENIGFVAVLNKAQRGASNIRINKFTAETLGGKIAVEEFTYKEKKRSPFVLEVRELDLAKLLAFVGERVQGTGKISGKLPIAPSEDVFTVDAGKLDALEPGGTIRYVAGPDSALRNSEDANLQLALRALENFSFDNLSAEVAYNKEGTMTAKLSLAGKNPELTTRPINFNINIEENIPMLLRSIRLATQAGKEVWQSDSK